MLANRNQTLAVPSDIPLVLSILDSTDRPIAVVSKACIHGFGVEQVCYMNKIWLAQISVDIDAELCVVMNFRKDRNLVLKLKVIAQSSIQTFSQISAIRIVVDTLRVEESLAALS